MSAITRFESRVSSHMPAADWLYQRHVKNYRIIFFACVVLAFPRAGNPCINLYILISTCIFFLQLVISSLILMTLMCDSGLIE